MNLKVRILAVTVFILVVTGMFVYAYLKNSEITSVSLDAAVPTADEQYSNIERVDAMHFYIDGTHTYVGDLSLPTPCDLLTSDLHIDGNNGELVFDVVNTADECDDRVVSARFMASAEAASDITTTATFKGRPIVLNIIEAPEGALPESFELYLK